MSHGPQQVPSSRAVRLSADGILAAAERVFTRVGYADTSLRQLMAEAGVSTTAFYARFPSKEAVLQGLVAQLLLDINTAAAEAISQAKTLEEGFSLGVEVLVKKLAHRRGILRLVLTEVGSNPAALNTYRETLGMLAQMLAARLSLLAAKGKIEPTDADALGWALVGALQIQVLRWAVFEELDEKQLAAALRATANTMLPAVTRKKRSRS